MKILLVSTLKRRVGVDVTASRSGMIYQLGKKLVENGHTVGLLGTKDSLIPGAATYSIIDKAFVDMPPSENQFYAETSFLVQMEKKIEEVGNSFDVIHNHTYPELINLYASERIPVPMVTTVHAQATQELDNALSLFPKANLVSISEAHKKLFKKAHFKWVIYNGIDTDLFTPHHNAPIVRSRVHRASRSETTQCPDRKVVGAGFTFQEKQKGYLLWLGRLGKAKDEKGNFIDAKGVRWAIKLAQETGERLLIAGNIEDMEFYEKDVKPHLNDRINWYGPLSSEQKLSKEEVVKLMQGAKAFLMTINWEEPFGLVMAEAMSCGTPVIGFNRGSVKEIVRDGVTGFVVDPSEGTEGLREALDKIDTLKRDDCRNHVEENFTIEKMVRRYEEAYRKILNV